MEKQPTNSRGKAILVVGGGMAGMTTALEAAEAGCEVILVEKSPWLGGRVARFNQYFPKLCPPTCGLEINFKRIKNNPGITVLTNSELVGFAGEPGNYEAKVKVNPRFVTEDCTLCGECEKVCPSERVNEFNYGLDKSKAVYIAQSSAFPSLYAIEREACRSGCKACVDACSYGAINLEETSREESFNVATIVAATGWKPYDAAKIDNLGYGKCDNVVTNVIMERLAAPDGPTGGKIERPSDNQQPKKVAFIQCAGSRDENHLPYCSAVCCSASLKQATYLRERDPECEVYVFYIDIRTPGRLEDFYSKVAEDEKVNFIKGKVAKIEEDPSTKDLLVTAEDVLGGRLVTERVNMVVLATGIVPNTEALPSEFNLDEFGFVALDGDKKGLGASGCARMPEEVSATVRDGTGAALKALQAVVRSAHHG